MQKLILVINWGDCVCSGISTIPIEYKSKSHLILDILDEVEKKESFGYVDIPLVGGFCSVEDLKEALYNNLYTLEEWFEQNKKTK